MRIFDSPLPINDSRLTTMKEDILLLVIVFVVWAALAILYATVPMFAMPGYSVVWGWGALVFLLLAVVIWIAQRRKPGSAAGTPGHGGPGAENAQHR